MNAERAATVMSRRFTKERRGVYSNMGASWRWAEVAAVTSAKRCRNRGRVSRKSSRPFQNEEFALLLVNAGGAEAAGAR
jgi:hypothetical protein